MPAPRAPATATSSTCTPHSRRQVMALWPRGSVKLGPFRLFPSLVGVEVANVAEADPHRVHRVSFEPAQGATLAGDQCGPAGAIDHPCAADGAGGVAVFDGN